jgi:hypothetical protein
MCFFLLLIGPNFAYPQSIEQQRIINMVKPQLIQITKQINISLIQTGEYKFEIEDKYYDKDKKAFSLPFIILALSLERYYKEDGLIVEVNRVADDRLSFYIYINKKKVIS